MPLVVTPSIDTDGTATPEDYGLIAWNWEPQFAITTTSTLLNTASRLNTWTIPVRKPLTVTNIHMNLTTVASAPTAGSCGVALYNHAGALLGSLVTGVSTTFTSTGFKTWALAGGPFTVPATGSCIVAAWWTGGTAPGFMRGVGVTDISLALVGVDNRMALADSTITTTPPSTLGTRTGTGTIPFWVGLS
jgi:hypothetical protein